jgi:hypothetical protein
VPTSACAAEATLAGVAGAALGGAVASMLGAGPLGAVIGGANGALSGWRRIYAWRNARGVLAFVLDSTWALPTTAAAVANHAVSAVWGQPGFLPGWSERRNRHVYARGFVLRRGFALTSGNVVTGAAGADGDLSERRRRLVDDHEDVHVWQARWFGPFYPALYGAWLAVGSIVGVAAWLACGRRERLGAVVDTTAYYTNPFEWWAYSRDGNWPPSRVVTRLAWRRPAAQPRADVRASARTRATPR